MADIMVVKYKNREYELLWNDYYSYFSGSVNGEQGFIP
jgi:hypothetical protein